MSPVNHNGVDFSSRFLCDPHFVGWAIKESGMKGIIFYRLMRIKSSSKYHKNTHNIILSCDVKKLIRDKLINDLSLFGGAVTEKDLPEYIEKVTSDDITKRLAFALLEMAKAEPYRVAILTNRENVSHYEKITEKLDKAKSVTIKAELEGVEEIERNFRQWTRYKDARRDVMMT